MIPVIHLDQWVRKEERLSLENFNNSHTQFCENQGQGHSQLPGPLQMRAAGAQGRELPGALTDTSPGTATSLQCPCCLPIEPGPRGQKSRKQPCPEPSAQFQPGIYHTQPDRWRVLHQQPAMPAGDDLLISLWFLRPALIEIHTASLTWLSLA